MSEAHSAAASRLATVPEAAAYLGLPVDAVRALVEAAFLQPAGQGPEGPLLDRGQLRAFLTWNLEGLNDEDPAVQVGTASAAPEALLEALRGRSGEMAQQALEVFAEVFPEALDWSPEEQARFVDQARGRLEAILAVTGHGSDLDEALAGDLRGVGAAAAADGAPLPQLLVVLRISRDLVVQTAVEVAAERGRHWSVALSLVLTRVLPVLDRLTDSLAQGYWSAVLGRQKEARARYEHVVEHSPEGVYEVDLEGRIKYANPQLGVILGRRRIDELEGSLLSEVMQPAAGSPSVGALLHPSGGPRHVELTVVRPDGVRRVLDVRTAARLSDDEVVGFQGVVRDVTATRELEAEKDRSLSSLLDDLRLSLVLIADLGAGLVAEGERLPAEQVRQVGTSITEQVGRLSSLVDDVSRVRLAVARTTELDPRPVELADVVHAALAGGDPGAATADVDVVVPAGLTVMADAEGLGHVLRVLVDEAVQHGRAPVRLEVEGVTSGELQLAVCERLPEAVSVAGDPARGDADLTLVRTLVEAMGGRVWRDTGPDGACSRLTVPVPNRRRGDDTITL